MFATPMQSSVRDSPDLSAPTAVLDVPVDVPLATLKAHPLFHPREHSRLANFRARDAYIARCGFVLLTAETLDALARLCTDQKVLDAGAGTGFMASRLAARGVNITASDVGGEVMSEYGMQGLHRRDHEGDSRALLPGDFDVVLLCWPPYQESFGFEVAQAMRAGQILVTQGEGKHGCTADDAFFDYVENVHRFEPMPTWTQRLNEHHLRFDGIHDFWQVWRKR